MKKLDSIISKYRVVYFNGTSKSNYLSYKQQMEYLKEHKNIDEDLSFVVYLVPINSDIEKINGSDWDDSPASCNAGQPSFDTLPEKSVIISGTFGGLISITVKE